MKQPKCPQFSNFILFSSFFRHTNSNNFLEGNITKYIDLLNHFHLSTFFICRLPLKQPKRIINCQMWCSSLISPNLLVQHHSLVIDQLYALSYLFYYCFICTFADKTSFLPFQPLPFMPPCFRNFFLSIFISFQLLSFRRQCYMDLHVVR